MKWTVNDFWKQVSTDIAYAKYESSGRRMIVTALEGSLVRLQDVMGVPNGVAAYAGIEQLAPGDEVWVEPVAALIDSRHSQIDQQFWVVLGKLHRTPTTSIKLAGDDLILVGGMAISGSSDTAGAVTTWSIDSDGDAEFKSLNTPALEFLSQGSSDVSATTSTTTYQDACSMSLVLSAGLWTVHAMGMLDAKHSLSGAVNMLTQIDGIDGGVKTLDCPSASYRTIKDNGKTGSVSGNRTIQIKVRYKSSDAGQTTANNPAVMAIATRQG